MSLLHFVKSTFAPKCYEKILAESIKPHCDWVLKDSKQCYFPKINLINALDPYKLAIKKCRPRPVAYYYIPWYYFMSSVWHKFLHFKAVLKLQVTWSSCTIRSVWVQDLQTYEPASCDITFEPKYVANVIYRNFCFCSTFYVLVIPFFLSELFEYKYFDQCCQHVVLLNNYLLEQS